MGIHGVDVSNHQAVFDFRGWQFAIIKSSEGNGFRDFRFAQHLNAARAAGCIVAAYHYQRNVSSRSQYDIIRSVVPRNVPVIIDVEEGSGPLSITRELVSLLREGGYSVPLTYLPRWYWDGHLGRPSLNGLPPLWASDYRGSGANWSDYGGLPVKLRQYTSTPFDKNYFEGTREQFAALLGSTQREDEELNETEKQRLEQTEAYAKEVWEAVGKEDANGKSVIHQHVNFLGDLILEVKALVEGVNAKVNELERDLAEVKTGGVSKEEIGRIARDAVGNDLKNDEE